MTQEIAPTNTKDKGDGDVTEKVGLAALAERLEKATALTRDLAHDLCVAFELAEGGSAWERRFWALMDADAYLDAAAALCERVLPGWGWAATSAGGASVRKPGDMLYLGDDVSGPRGEHTPTPALALCLAVVRAKETK